MISAYYTQQLAVPVNSRRAGTIRHSNTDPRPIKVWKPFPVSMVFGFNDEQNHAWSMIGRTITATMVNRTGQSVSAVVMKPGAEDSLGVADFLASEISIMESGYYYIILSYVDEFGKDQHISSPNNTGQFVVQILETLSNRY